MSCLLWSAQLWWVFRQYGEVDFTEIALKARQALVESGQPTDQLLTLDRQIDHILVDEFQDTSWLQFDLLTTLVSGWQPDDGRTLFLVGDPMQSIYSFPRGPKLVCSSRPGNRGLVLFACNHYSSVPTFAVSRGLLMRLIAGFPRFFLTGRTPGGGRCVIRRRNRCSKALDGDAVSVYPGCIHDAEAEAVQVVELINTLRCCHPSHTIAVLVRSRTHLKNILPLLQKQAIEYQAQDIDVLTRRAGGFRSDGLDQSLAAWR